MNGISLIFPEAILIGSNYSFAMSCKGLLTGASAIPVAPMANAEMMKAEGDFIHSIWETGRLILTRRVHLSDILWHDKWEFE